MLWIDGLADGQTDGLTDVQADRNMVTRLIVNKNGVGFLIDPMN